VNGVAVSDAHKIVMQPADEVTLETPGGGGYGKVAVMNLAAE
jgi:N-methylhydantoinase B/oxoprolinase/acetone carboxylase alpha subunit